MVTFLTILGIIGIIIAIIYLSLRKTGIRSLTEFDFDVLEDPAVNHTVLIPGHDPGREGTWIDDTREALFSDGTYFSVYDPASPDESSLVVSVDNRTGVAEYASHKEIDDYAQRFAEELEQCYYRSHLMIDEEE